MSKQQGHLSKFWCSVISYSVNIKLRSLHILMVLSLLKTWSVREMLVASCSHRLRETCQKKLNFSRFCLLYGRWINKLHVSKAEVVLSFLCHTGAVIANTFSTLTCAMWGKTGFLHEEWIQEAASRATPQTCLASLSSPSSWQIYWEFKPCTLKEFLLIPPQCRLLPLKATRLSACSWEKQTHLNVLSWAKYDILFSVKKKKICVIFGQVFFNVVLGCLGFFPPVVSHGHSWACVV